MNASGIRTDESKINTKGQWVKGSKIGWEETPRRLCPFAPLTLCVDILPYTQLQLALKLAAGPSDFAMGGFV
jgi:hypothetical protein